MGGKKYGNRKKAPPDATSSSGGGMPAQEQSAVGPSGGSTSANRSRSLQIATEQAATGPSQQQNQPQPSQSESRADTSQQQRSGRDQPAAQNEGQNIWNQPGKPKGQQQKQQSGVARAKPNQPIQSTSSQGSQTAASKGSKSPNKESAPALSMEGVQKLAVAYKGKGTRGKPLGLIETNYLELAVEKLVENVFHYDVTIEPNTPKKLLATVFWEFKRQNFPSAYIAFDGSRNAFASTQLTIPNDLKREIVIIHPITRRERKYVVSIKPANDSLIPVKQTLKSYKTEGHREDSRRAMQAIEVILKSAFYQDHLRDGIVGGRSFFPAMHGSNRDLDDFYELRLGLFQSLVLGDVPFLNVDVNHKAFPKHYDSLVDMGVRNVNQTLGRDVEGDLRKHLSGLDICYSVQNAKSVIYKFMRIVGSPANVQLTLENNEKLTVLDYFRKIQRPIKYPNLNCIQLGNTVKNITVPMEFCSIPDKQIVNKKCTEKQTSAIIKIAATDTNERKRKIDDLLRQIQHNSSSTIKGFGLRVDMNFAKVPVRQLSAPSIQYANGKVDPRNGSWRSDRKKFLEPGTATAWAILNTNYATCRNDLEELGRLLVRYSGQNANGISLAPSPSAIFMFSDREVPKIKQELQRIGAEKVIKIVFVVIPNGGPTYATIKKTAELDFGVLTQCIKGGTLRRVCNPQRPDLSIVTNILLKVNAKLNGTNHKINSPILSDGQCMFVGADVTHPSPDQTKIPSVVGVVSSYDQNAFCYYGSHRYQGPCVEIIQDFKGIMIEHLMMYKQHNNNKLPQKIFYYRDGVSDGQFDDIMAIERQAMIQACREVKEGYEKSVRITIIVVQKRHHTRFFPGDTDVGKGDRNNNVPPGTIVDTVITPPLKNHFYLVSHQAIQGVAKPTKYCILLDEGNHNIDDLQELTYNLCHLFARCNRSVSYPAPTYLAHHFADRGRTYITDETLIMDDLDREYNKRKIKRIISQGHPMFFV